MSKKLHAAITTHMVTRGVNILQTSKVLPSKLTTLQIRLRAISMIQANHQRRADLLAQEKSEFQVVSHIQ